MADNKWETVTIESLISDGTITAHKDGNYGSYYPRTTEFGDEGVPFLTAKLLSDSGQVFFNEAPRLNFEKAEKLTFGFVEEGDVLLSHNATIGRVAVVPRLEERMLVGTSLTYFRLNRSRLLPRFLAAYFSGRDFQNQLKAVMSHSTRNQVPITAQRKLKVILPPLADQKRISDILGSLDDKIELNRRMKETLETMARRLFKSWFLDFDPVHAKAHSRREHPNLSNAELCRLALPKLAPEIAKPFPDEFEDSIIGQIPKGWKTRPLYDVAKFVNGAAFKDSDFCDPTVGKPVIKIAELKSGITSQTKYSLKDVGAEREIRKGDIVYSWSGSPDTSLAAFRWAGQDGLLNQHIFNVVTDTRPQTLFVYYLLTDMRGVLVEIARDKQTTGLGHITVADMKRLHVVQPPIEVLESFERTVGSLYDLSFNAEVDSMTLEETRNRLLPRLLSGDLLISQEVA